jgi:hypothetical protein
MYKNTPICGKPNNIGELRCLTLDEYEEMRLPPLRGGDERYNQQRDPASAARTRTAIQPTTRSRRRCAAAMSDTTNNAIPRPLRGRGPRYNQQRDPAAAARRR